MMIHIWLSVFCIALVLDGIVCPPVTVKKAAEAESSEQRAEDDPDFGLEYERYLKEIVGVLESDETFRKKLEDSNISEIKSHNLEYKRYMDEVMSTLVKDPKFLERITKTKDLTKESGEIARHLEFVSHGIRSKLDEIKRKEIDRLRQAMKMQHQLERGMPRIPINPALLQDPPGMRQRGQEPKTLFDKEKILGHVDHKNPNSFEVEDLAKLIKRATQDLEDIDQQRREEFKRYEMEKDVEQKEKLNEMDEQHKQDELKKIEEMKKKHADHPKLHHPGSKDQLEEVWEEGDGMNKEDFNPRTFFALHDTNGDGILDEGEVEALFQAELDKVYDPNNPEDDLVERYEEMNRMREHVFNEIDANGDKMIELEEFLKSTQSKGFNEDEGWDTLEDEKQYTDEELEQFVKEYEERQRQDYDRQGHQVPIDPSQQPIVHDSLDQGQGQPIQMDQHQPPQHQQAGQELHFEPHQQQQQFAEQSVEQQQAAQQQQNSEQQQQFENQQRQQHFEQQQQQEGAAHPAQQQIQPDSQHQNTEQHQPVEQHHQQQQKEIEQQQQHQPIEEHHQQEHQPIEQHHQQEQQHQPIEQHHQQEQQHQPIEHHQQQQQQMEQQQHHEPIEEHHQQEQQHQPIEQHHQQQQQQEMEQQQHHQPIEEHHQQQ